MLGRPVMMLRVRSSKYRLHHVRTSVSRFAAVADGSSLRTWRPGVYAKRRAIPIIVQALSYGQQILLEVVEAGWSRLTGSLGLWKASKMQEVQGFGSEERLNGWSWYYRSHRMLWHELDI